MKLIWFEDFLVLSAVGNFSKAAELRHISQPAFSRRIQMLEEWLGIELVDRRNPRLTLTTTAARFEPEIRAMVNRIYELKREMGLEEKSSQRIILSAQHMLSIIHLPMLLQALNEHQTNIAFRIRAANREECIAQFLRGESDLLLCCETPGVPVPNLGGFVEQVEIGKELLLPVTARNTGDDLSQNNNFKLLSYPEDSFLGRVIWNHCLPMLMEHYCVETVCESAFTMGLKEMALFGMGIAWLPQGLIKRELNAGSLVSLEPEFASVELQVSLYYLRRNTSPVVEEVWQSLKGMSRSLISAEAL